MVASGIWSLKSECAWVILDQAHFDIFFKKKKKNFFKYFNFKI